MKSLDILLSIVEDAQTQICANTTRDRITILHRYENEGLSFLGITLPYFGEWLETSICQGKAATTIFPHFKKKSGGSSVLPCFLHGLTSLVFDRKTGLILKEPNENAVFFIRQICYFHKKVFAVCDPKRDAVAKANFENVDRSLRNFVMPSGDTRSQFWKSALSSAIPALESAYSDPDVVGDLLPKHGPGATADKLWANGKYRSRGFLQRWGGIFSWEELYGFSTIHQTEGREVAPIDELPAKVVSVPKTMKTSRIICVEPTVMQYAQQLVSNRLRKAFEFTGVHHQLNFTDQTVNQRYAQCGSIGGGWATIDLSEASDRLHSKVVSRLFMLAPTIRRHVFACRSSRVLLHDGRILNLRKYASMGSALTFPIEAFAFYTICVAALLDFYSRGTMRHGIVGLESVRTPRIPRELMEFCKKRVFVFGDDIIVPEESTTVVYEYLEAFGLRVNSKKSFSQGLFRESCGTDWMNGCLVTPVYLRQFHPVSRRDAVEFTSWVSMANRFHVSGLWKAAEATREYLDSIFKCPLVGPNCSGLGYIHYSGAYTPYRLSKRSQEWVVKTLAPYSGKIRDELTEYDALLKTQLLGKDCDLERSQSPSWLRQKEGGSSLTHSPKRGSLKLRLKTVTAY